MASDAPESSRARQRQGPEERRPWVALASFPAVLADGDELPRRNRTISDDVLLALHNPPRLSSLLVLRRNYNRAGGGAYPYPYVHATDDASGIFLFEDMVQGQGSSGSGRRRTRTRTGLFLYDASSSTTRPILDVPDHLRLQIHHGCSLGLLPNPHRPGHHVIASLHPMTSSLDNDNVLLCYSTATTEWTRRTIDPSPRRRLLPLADHGVIAHGGRLWWVSLAHGIFFCDPSDFTHHLRFIPLPPLPPGERQDSVQQRRCVKASQGSLRFVQMTRGVSTVRITMSTLHGDDLDGANPWFVEYDADIAYPGPTNELHLPLSRVALVDPDDCYLLYVFQDTSVFALLDMRQRRLLACAQNHHSPPDLVRRSVVHVFAWRLPPDEASSSSPSLDVQAHPVDGASSGGGDASTWTRDQLRRAQDALPPAPETFVVAGERQKLDAVGWALYDRHLLPDNWHDPSAELLLHHHPKTEWHEVWMGAPLVLHDARLVAVRKLWYVLESEALLDLTRTMMGILEQHPGPVLCWRIDSSQCPCASDLDKIMSLMSEKGGALNK